MDARGWKQARTYTALAPAATPKHLTF